MGISLLTMSAGNVKVLKKTFESASKICDEIIYGDLLLWEDDRILVESYKKEFNIKIVKYPFNYIFKNGFSAILNSLSDHATNDLTLYLNTSEIIEENFGIREAIESNPDCNAFYFTHKTDGHRWYRLGNRKELRWSGILHEQLSGDYKPYHKSIFQMADLPKDSDSQKAIILDQLKECVYFEQYMRIADDPLLLGETDPGWLTFARNDYESFKKRLSERQEMYDSLKSGDWGAFKDSWNKNVPRETMQSNQGIEYQTDEKYLGK